jgi:hypothetical protein
MASYLHLCESSLRPSLPELREKLPVALTMRGVLQRAGIISVSLPISQNGI